LVFVPTVFALLHGRSKSAPDSEALDMRLPELEHQT